MTYTTDRMGRKYYFQPQDMTNVPVDGDKEYRKKTTIQAVKIPYEFSLSSLEGRITGKAGDWLAIGVKGERYIIADDVFKSTYELVER